jgi:hypothetical protein
MSWERQPLFTKAKLFFEKASNEDKEEPFFGLWCAMGLELLARSAIAKVSPTLLAEPDREHQNLLHALNLGQSIGQSKSISTIIVLNLCKSLVTDFTDQELKIASALISRRNEDLHSGGVAFDQYPTQQWISGFYKCCKVLCEFQDESLLTLFGEEIEREANVILAEVAKEILGKTKALIAAHKKVFENKDQHDQIILKRNADKNSENLASKGHHRTECPACQCMGTVIGEPFGKSMTENKDFEIVVRQSILPTKFHCIGCELKLTGFSALLAAGIGNHYTRRTTFSPEEYYDLINPEDNEAITERYTELNPPDGFDEWNNE